MANVVLTSTWPQKLRLTIYLYSAHRAVIFAIAQLSCFLLYLSPPPPFAYSLSGVFSLVPLMLKAKSNKYFLSPKVFQILTFYGPGNQWLWKVAIFSRPYQPYLVRSRLCDRLASVCCLSATLCIVAKRCVLEQKLLLTAYKLRKSYMRNWLVPKWMTLTFV